MASRVLLLSPLLCLMFSHLVPLATPQVLRLTLGFFSSLCPFYPHGDRNPLGEVGYIDSWSQILCLNNLLILVGC